MGREMEEKLTSIQTDLVVLSESIGTVKAEKGKMRLDVVNNSGILATHEATLDMMQLKLADMEDWSRRCNVRITGLAEGLEGSNAIQFLTHSLPKWFPSLSNLKGELMQAHHIYSDDRKKQVGATRTDFQRSPLYHPPRHTLCCKESPAHD
ncbi:hypothetical protein KUCAC02_017739 [Chaenocephalus aceratus]|uniref:Uncharacterized protein n=1 Tax=Chaenocephalus aceratus TaxID=36190 RepID=A0ACB9W3I9_CHAAC|nr:hypothetical protein KUCAC02_017739 [Chaenocephalus aceratus]